MIALMMPTCVMALSVSTASAPLSRADVLRRAALLASPAPLLVSRLAAADEPPPALATGESGVVMRGVLQMEPALASKVPSGSVASVAIRVVGRNTKGPLASLQVPLEGKTFPVEYSVERSNLREGLADFVWLEEDIYVYSALMTPSGKQLAEGRSKAKFIQVDGQPAHKVAALLLE